MQLFSKSNQFLLDDCSSPGLIATMNWRKLLFWRKSECDHASGDRHTATFQDVWVKPVTGEYAGMTVVVTQAEHHECINCGATWWVFKENDVESIHG